MREIVLDPNGGDDVITNLLPGVFDSLGSDDQLNITLVIKDEDEGMVRELIDGQPEPSFFYDRIKIIKAGNVLYNNDNPVKSAAIGADYTVTKAVEYIKDRSDSCLISVGNTAAVLILTLSRIGLKDGVTKPALASLLPRYDGDMFCLLDCGANLSLTAEDMLEFAKTGADCIKRSFKKEAPKVALLSVGKEKEKGTAIIKEAHKLLEKSSLNFIGNVEPDDIFGGDADVIVCDGFAGNMILKNTEATGAYLRKVYEKMIEKRSVDEDGNAGNSFGTSTWNEMEHFYSFNDYGGAILLGVNANIIKAHGKANAETIKSCIELGRTLIG